MAPAFDRQHWVHLLFLAPHGQRRLIDAGGYVWAVDVPDAVRRARGYMGQGLEFVRMVACYPKGMP